MLLLMEAAFYLFVSQRFPFISALLCIFFWIIRSKESAVHILLVIGLLAFPRWSDQKPEVHTGFVREIRSAYCIVENGEYRFLLYTGEELPYDSEIQFTGTFSQIDRQEGFFRFHFDDWCHSSGIHYGIDASSVTVVREHFSIRRLIQKRIDLAEDPVREMLKANLLNIKEKGNSVYEGGFSFSGLFLILDLLLKYFVDRKKRKIIMTVTAFVICVVYRFPVLVLMYLSSTLLSFTSLSRNDQSSWSLLIVLLICPGSLKTISFLFPAVLKLTSRKKDRYASFTASMMIQSLFFYDMKPLHYFMYGILKGISGVLRLISLIQLFLIRIPLIPLFLPLNSMMKAADLIALNGSVCGLGIVFFLPLIMSFLHLRDGAKKAAAALIVFQLAGLFHPFAEVTFINVGQGDSILVRMPLNSQNVLIDTGKPSQETVLRSFLKAKGIRKIHTLIITHSDDDHSGNMDMIINEFHPDSVITEHGQNPVCERPVMFDLNRISDDDENRSSVIQYFRLNGLRYLMMADADQFTEQSVISEYGDLQCDVLKLSHHGSDTGSCDRFLDTVRPSLAVVSAGSYSLYHHPSPEVIQRLLKRHIPWLETKQEGDISVICLPGFNLMLTSAGKISVLK